MTDTLPYQNPASEAERREVLENDSYLWRQQHELDTSGGRYVKITPTTVTGATPTPQYPKIPSGPWSGDDPVPPEEPLGIDINKMEP